MKIKGKVTYHKDNLHKAMGQDIEIELSPEELAKQLDRWEMDKLISCHEYSGGEYGKPIQDKPMNEELREKIEMVFCKAISDYSGGGLIKQIDLDNYTHQILALIQPIQKEEKEKFDWSKVTKVEIGGKIYDMKDIKWTKNFTPPSQPKEINNIKGWLRAVREENGDDPFIRYQLGLCSKGYLLEIICRELQRMNKG